MKMVLFHLHLKLHRLFQKDIIWTTCRRFFSWNERIKVLELLKLPKSLPFELRFTFISTYGQNYKNNQKKRANPSVCPFNLKSLVLLRRLIEQHSIRPVGYFPSRVKYKFGSVFE